MTVIEVKNAKGRKAGSVDLLILSAQFGLISGDTPIPYYDRRMTVRRAIDLRPRVCRQAAHWLGGVKEAGMGREGASR